MIASLPMYDFPWVRAAIVRLWASIRDKLRARGIDAPEALTQEGDIRSAWMSDSLLLGQTCGYPYWRGVRCKAEILAVPIYGFAGCEGPYHRSFLIARRDDPRESLAEFRSDKAAINGADSNSGMNLFRAAVAPLAGCKPFFADVVETGGHAYSLLAVAEKRAGVAAIDCVTYALLVSGASQLVAQIKIIGETPSSPALPFIASRALPAATRAAVRQVLRELPPIPELGLAGVAFLPETAYARVEKIEREAVDAGYPRLA
jgi:ABC-type phosphate/phosphonate transport system substrate-binding protein